jgi:hypothetical protein
MREPVVADMTRRAEGGGEHPSERTRTVRERGRTDEPAGGKPTGGIARIGRQGGDR